MCRSDDLSFQKKRKDDIFHSVSVFNVGRTEINLMSLITTGEIVFLLLLTGFIKTNMLKIKDTVLKICTTVPGTQQIRSGDPMI